ncbi:hypothetical protein [Asticcacaulis sp. AC402]|uniref:hypothetical protein n=1 Tax=Asticcacaulis sp. AC402 TaxID=1282361 RepID=UPI0003C3B860|nr:hypothetical protein [Asticcacaulis sp. AC402]ESQ74786.1 hypothetical protein ABAC402_12840 [Asticcacaulis sp. AC402]
MARFLNLLPHGMAIFMALVFIDSLRFKFLNLPQTQVIFGKLDAWAASLGAAGLFGQTGLFSQYVIGSIELLAAALLLIGILPRFRHLQAGGALAGMLVMSGAIAFHLFTPLGTDPNNDGGGLFIAACLNWLFAVSLLFAFRRNDLIALLTRIGSIFRPTSA